MMNRKALIGICAAAVMANFAAGCSDNSSGASGDDFIDRGEVNIPIPGDSSDSKDVESSSAAAKPASSESKVASSSSEKVTASSSSEKATVSSSSASKPASSSSEKAPASSAEVASGDWEDYCLEVVNAKRATEDLPPLSRATAEREKCATDQAAADMKANKGHANFGNCGEFAQNTGPNINTKWYGTETKIVDTYVNMMWDDEKALVTSGERDPNKSEDYSYIGHYLNMKNTAYKSLACGIYFSEDGTKAWFNMNFY